MRININNDVFGKGELKNVLGKGVGIQVLSEYDWFSGDGNAFGFIKEIRIKGMCFLAYNLSVYNNDEILLTNTVPIFKLHFEFDGDVKYEFERGVNRNVNIKKGRFELIYSTQENNKIISSKETKNSVELFFDEAYLLGFLGKDFSQLLSVFKNKPEEETSINYGVFMSEEIIEIINVIKACEYTGSKRNVFLELKIKELIIVALTTYGDNFNEDEKLISEEQSLQSVENYIKLNLKKELNITELSILAAMNTSKFKKVFREFYGTTVFKYITSLRIEKAKELIQQKAYTISQASYEVGYKNAQHFTVAFKKNRGYLPSELKK